MVKKTEEPTVDAIDYTEKLSLDTVDDSPDIKVPVEKLLKWRKQGLSYSEIGKMIGRSKQAVHQRLQSYIDAIDNLPAFKENRADIFAIHQQRLLNSLTDDDIKRMPPGSRLTGFGILYDKERLERSLSTENVSYADYTEKISQEREIQAENLRKIKDIEAEEAELKAQLKAIESKSSGTGSKDD
jgi:transposase